MKGRLGRLGLRMSRPAVGRRRCRHGRLILVLVLRIVLVLVVLFVICAIARAICVVVRVFLRSILDIVEYLDCRLRSHNRSSPLAPDQSETPLPFSLVLTTESVEVTGDCGDAMARSRRNNSTSRLANAAANGRFRDGLFGVRSDGWTLARLAFSGRPIPSLAFKARPRSPGRTCCAERRPRWSNSQRRTFQAAASGERWRRSARP